MTTDLATEGRIFVTADTHFGQSDACLRYDRPFTDTAAMESAICAAETRGVGGDAIGCAPSARVASAADRSKTLTCRVARTTRSDRGVMATSLKQGGLFEGANRRHVAKVTVGMGSGHASAWCPLQKSMLHQERLVDLFNRPRILADGRCNRTEPNRSAVELLNDGLE